MPSLMLRPPYHYFLTSSSISLCLFLLVLTAHEEQGDAFQMMSKNNDVRPNQRRRRVLQAGGGGILSGLPFFGGKNGVDPAVAAGKSKAGGGGPTNQVVKVVNGIKHRRLGGSDIVVSEIGLGAQRWVSADFNAPDKDLCYQFMDEAILKRGVNLIDTAEQYPIPSDGRTAKEGDSELLIGSWMKDRKVKREDVCIATKITGGRNITPRNIEADLEGSLERLGTDYVDVYLLHWPQRYSPQSNWGQSLKYKLESDASPYWRGRTSFEDLCMAMEKMIQKGKIRGWGMCNDNAYGLTASTRTAKMLGTTPPACLQGDFSILDRKSEENGVAEAASQFNENVGFMSYNALAGGMLTGKYLKTPAAFDDPDRESAMASAREPRGRMDTRGWGGTLYRYRTEAAREAIADYAKLAKGNSMSLTELSLRWNRQRDMLTTTLLGHTSLDQLKETLDIFAKKEPLSNELMWEIDRIHMRNRLPLFSSNRVGKDWFGEGEIGEPIP